MHPKKQFQNRLVVALEASITHETAVNIGASKLRGALRQLKLFEESKGEGTVKTTDELVREIVDREAIRDLPARYCDCLWRKDIDGLVDLFAEDATFVIGGTEVNAVSRGLAAVRKTHEKALAETTPRLFVHNQIVNLLGDGRARSRCAVEVRNFRITMEWIGVGYFEDEYIKQGDQWKFFSRYHTFDGIDNKVYLRTFIA